MQQWLGAFSNQLVIANVQLQLPDDATKKKAIGSPVTPHEDKCVGEVSYQCVFSIRDTLINAKSISVSSAAVINVSHSALGLAALLLCVF